MRRRDAFLAAGLAALPLGLLPAPADPLPRTAPFAGSVIARKSGEEARFIEIGSWQTVDLRQDLLAGDVLRTNAAGNLAILFSDRTQVRLGRNSTLAVRKVGGGGEDTELSLEAGQLWARAERGGEGVAVATPAATAAIRGTDWSMSVDGGKTSLIVLEGSVELANAQGSLIVNRGEGAVAAIGQAPTKLTIVDPDDREQMLFYYSLDSAFSFLPASSLPSRDMRTARARIRALPEGSRSTEDWVTLAEVALSYEGEEAARAAVARARALRLTAGQKARLDLIDALFAGAERRHADAARLFERAAAGLDPRRRAIALHGGYFARSLADPARAEAPPATPGGGPYGAIAEAFTASFLQDVPAAIRILRDAERRFPEESVLPAIRAQFATFLDDRPQVREAIDRALSLDPDDVNARIARANYRSDIEGDLDGALADLSRATAVAPGSTAAWNNLGLVHDARGAPREAEAAFRRAIALDPRDPVSYANLAFLHLDQDRLAEAKEMIGKAITADPSFDVAQAARGRLRLQSGEFDGAVDDFLAASTANPAYSQGLLGLAAAYYESGQREAGKQALDNADRLDPNDPAVPNFLTAIAISEYDSDQAIASAQEGLRRARARGGRYASLSANRSEGSTLNNAYRLQGLDAWGRYHGDAVFDPFDAVALTDQSRSGSPSPFFVDLDFGGVATEPALNSNYFSSYFQGLLLDPAILTGRARSANLLRRPFVEGALGGGFVATRDGDPGWNAEAEFGGFAAAPFPVSFSGTISGRRNDDPREGTFGEEDASLAAFTLGDDDVAGSGYIAAKPTPNDRIVAYVDARRDTDDLVDGSFTLVPPSRFLPYLSDLNGASYERSVRDASLTSGVAASHSFGYRNVLNAAFFASGFERSSEEEAVLDLSFLGRFDFTATREAEAEFNQQIALGAVSHSIGFGDLALRYGAEGGRVAQGRHDREILTPSDPALNPIILANDTSARFRAGRAYLDALYEVTPDLKVEAGLFGTVLSSDEITVDGQDGGALSIERVEPRVGLAWEALPGQWLRVGFLRESGAFAAASLAPAGVVGLQSNQLPLGVAGFVDTFAARWDAEWTSRFFTSVDFQRQNFDGISIPVPGGITTIDLEEGRIDRVSGTANYHLGGGVGLFGTVAYADSLNETAGAGLEDPVPYVAELAGRAGVTYVNTANLKLTLAATYVGEREDDLGGPTLDPYWTTDAFLTWEPLDRRFEVELAGYNLLDEEFDVAGSSPGWSRTFTGSLKVRF